MRHRRLRAGRWPPMDPVEVIVRAGGAARAADLRRAGCSRRQIARAAAEVPLVQLGRGALAVPGTDRSVLAAVRCRASLACVSALHHRDVELLTAPDRPHLTGNRGSPDRRVRWHRGRGAGLALDLPQAAAQLLGCGSPAAGLVAVDHLLRTERASLADIRDQLPAHGGGHAQWVLHHAAPLAGSVLESLLRCVLLRGGVGELELQVPVPGVGRVDLLVAGWLVIETDGWATHGDRSSFELDRQRDAVSAEQGLQTLRFTWSAVYDRPARVLACVRAVLAAGRSGLPPSTSATTWDRWGD